MAKFKVPRGDLAYPEVTCGKMLGPNKTIALHTGRPFLQVTAALLLLLLPFPSPREVMGYKNKSLEVRETHLSL